MQFDLENTTWWTMHYIQSEFQSHGLLIIAEPLPIELSAAVPQSDCCLFRGDVSLRLCHHLVPNSTLVAGFRNTIASNTHPTRNFRTVALRRRGG